VYQVGINKGTSGNVYTSKFKVQESKLHIVNMVFT